jgi:hypothetical protein
MDRNRGFSRRDFLLAAGVAGALGVSGSLLGACAALGHDGEEHGASHGAADSGGMAAHGGNGAVGEVDFSKFDPSKFSRQFYWGEERAEGGRTVREYELSAEAVEVEVAPGVMYPAWAHVARQGGRPVAGGVQEQGRTPAIRSASTASTRRAWTGYSSLSRRGRSSSRSSTPSRSGATCTIASSCPSRSTSRRGSTVLSS